MAGATTQQVDLVNLDSSFRTSGSAYDFTLSTFNTIHNVRQIEVLSVDFPAVTVNGINHSNNILILARNSLSRAYVTITIGSYTDATLATEIQTQLNAGTGVFGTTTWTCVFAASKYTITNGATINFYVASDGLANTTLGFDAPAQTATASVTSNGTTSLNSDNYILITSQALNPQQGVPSTVQYSRIVHTIDSTNNTIVLNDSIATYTVTIPNGQYNIYELAAAMQTQFAAQASASAATPIYVEYIFNTTTSQVDFQIRGSASMTLSGTLVKTLLNYYTSSNTTTSNIQIYNAPLSATDVLIINPQFSTATTNSIGVPDTTFKWRGAAKASNGKLYFAPFDASNVLIINTLNDTADTTTITVSAGADGFDTTNRWAGAVTAPNGKIYFTPYGDRWWASVDPTNDTLNRNVEPVFSTAYHNTEVTKVVTVADVAGSLGGKYFNFDAPGTPFYAWIDVDNGSADPAPGGRTGIEVNISSGDTAAAVATAIQTAVDANGNFTSVIAQDGSVIIYNVAVGDVTTSADVDTGFTITRIGRGYAVTEQRIVAPVADVAGSLNNTYFTIYSATTSYYTWFNVGGVGVDPTPGGVAIPITIATNASAFAITYALVLTFSVNPDFTIAFNMLSIEITNSANGATPSAADVNTGFTFAVEQQGNVGSPEITSITPVADVGGSLSSTYFTINSPGTSYYVWMNVNGVGVDPTPGGTGIAVVFAASSAADVVGLAVAAAIDAVGDFHVSNASVSIANAAAGQSSLSQDFGTGFTITQDTGSGGKGVSFFSDGVLVGNEIYGIPWQIGNGLSVLDTELGVVRDIVDVQLANPAKAPQYSAGVYVPNHNKIYACPFFHRNSIMVIDCSDDSIAFLTDPLIPTQSLVAPGYELYSDMVLAGNGKIYCIPFSEDFILVLDTATDPPTFSSPVGLRDLGTVASAYTIADTATVPSPVNSIANARKWSSGVLTPDQKIWCIPLLDTRVLVIDTTTDTYTVATGTIPSGPDKWIGGAISDSFTIYEDSLRKSTSGHVIHKTYLNNPTNGRIVATTGNANINTFSAGYDISTIDLKVTDGFGNLMTEFTGDFNMLLRITHN